MGKESEEGKEWRESQKEGIRNNELGEQVWREKELKEPLLSGYLKKFK
jgi:hypothetical protein